ncbi:hypothetical protein MMC31_002688 [Peltigera leucophlebia]|nr:hypothetical protein [Peltigera leucophlebia]
MPRKLEHESEDPKYPDIVLVTPAWREVSKERRRSTTQLIEQRALCAFLQNEEARQRHLSPYWTPKIQEVKETKK